MPRVRMLCSGASETRVWDAEEEVDMTPSEASIWADGVRGELVRDVPVETPESNRRKRGPRPETAAGVA